MKDIKTVGMICITQNNIEYKICKIIYTLYEDETYKYEFYPNYNIIKLLSDFQGIPGLNLELEKEVYVRENIIPVFISERAPNKNREDLWLLLEEVELDYLNQLEWLIRTNTKYSGDKLYVEKYEQNITRYDSFDILGNNSSEITKKILNIICSGEDATISSVSIDNSNRETLYYILHNLYLKGLNYKKQQQKESNNGRPSIIKNSIIEQEIFELYFKKEIKLDEALKQLDLKQATFYRKYKEFKKNINFK